MLRRSPLRFRVLALAVLPLAALTLLGAACAQNPRPAAPTRPAAPSQAGTESVSPLDQLQADLRAIFDAPAFHRATWGVEVRSLSSNDVLFELNASKLMMPGSNMKILTVAAAAERLGWDFRYETTLSTAAPVIDGVLKGDLVVSGTGDPTVNSRGGADPSGVFDSWADRLAAHGVRRIEGRIIGDDNAFDDEGLGAGWSWDYLAYGYAAPDGALQYNENVVTLTIAPGEAPGLAAVIVAAPPDSGLVVRNQVTTTAAGSTGTAELRRLPGSAIVTVIGTIPQHGTPVTRQVSVDNPTEYFVRALHRRLLARGIVVTGDAVDVDFAPPAADLLSQGGGDAPHRVLVRHTSPPLSEIATTLMKVSQNLYADTLLKTLGAYHGSGRSDPFVPGGGLSAYTPAVGTFESGRAAVRAALESWGVAADEYVMYDGSGLSRYNYVAPAALVKVLTRMYGDRRHRDTFFATLPVAGHDGTLSRRMAGTAAERNARAKTGSILNVRSLSGYVTTADGEPLAFSIIANHFTAPPSDVDAATDRAVARLAEFSRVRPRS